MQVVGFLADLWAYWGGLWHLRSEVEMLSIRRPGIRKIPTYMYNPVVD